MFNVCLQMEMLAEDSTEAESVVPGASQEAADAVEVSLCVITWSYLY